MKLNILIILLSFTGNSISAQNGFLATPIEGQYGNEYIIVNYVDWSIDSILDHQCGTKTYDGHQGTDFVIKGFSEMDAGVNVKAGSDGVVTFIKDGEFDKETAGDTSKHFGNFICIKHPNKYYSYYAHLKSGSLLVHPGDTVITGQKIAEVGSSGNSTDPHLHFELWYDSLYLVDPFSGNCGNSTTQWINPILYDTSFAIWKSGLTPILPSLNDLRYGVSNKLKFDYNYDPYITYWDLQYGLRKGDVSTIKWYNDTGLVYSYDYTYDKDYWFYYFWTYIFTTTTGVCDNCLVEYYLNGTLKSSTSFQVALVTGTIDINKNLNKQNLQQYLSNHSGSKAILYNTTGQCLGEWKKNNSQFPNGLYFVQIFEQSGKSSCYRMLIIN